MGMFSQTEILLMVLVIGVLFTIILILTILDIRDLRKNKIEEDEDYAFGEELEVNKELNESIETPKENVMTLEADKNEEILISDIVEESVKVDNLIIEEEPIMIEEVEDDISSLVIEEVDKNNQEEIKPIVMEEEKKVDIQEELNKVLETIPSEDKLVTSFEEEQEKTAIISLDELMQKSDALYNSNEISQYDEGNEPISIDEVISMFNKEDKQVPEVMQDIVEEKKEAYTHKETTPFISSVYGIETSDNNLSFENTATYEKLSRSKKNEFMAKLREMNENK